MKSPDVASMKSLSTAPFSYDVSAAMFKPIENFYNGNIKCTFYRII